mmetsp:Transcript_122661/g.343325  ORF Transcript_122661/g.343325 Transcript_122661/m.343325 type:complete len:220 (-) Transcript_122661:2042-2701(-)
MAAAAREHVVDGGDAVRGALDLGELHGLHESGGGEQERGVRHPPGCRDDLAAPAHDGVVGEAGVQDLELAAPDLLVAQRALLRRPLEALHQAVLALAEQRLVDLTGQGVIDEDVGAVVLGPEGPDGLGGERVPIVVLLEKVGDPAALPIDPHLALLDVLADALLQRLRHHEQLVLLVRRLREALQRARLHDSLAELDDGVRDLDLQVAVEPAEVVEDAI